MAHIHDLILTGDVGGLERFLRTQTNVAALVNEVDEWRRCTPLFTAVEQRPVNSEIIRLLLDAGADPNYVKIQNSRIFSFPEHIKVGRFTIPNPFAKLREPYGSSTVSQMLKTGDLALVKLFEQYGADLVTIDPNNYSSILHAIFSENDPTEVVDYLLNLGVSPDTKSTYGETAIVASMRLGWYRTVQLLVSAGADESPIAWSPVIRATAIGTIDDVTATLSADHDLEATDATGCTALHIALKRGDEARVELLLDAGASVGRRTTDQRSPLHFAAEGRNPNLVLRMLKAGCFVGETDRMRSTALGIAAEYGDTEIVRILLEHGANPTKGETFDSIISKSKDRQTLLLLLEAGADPAELDASGRRTLVGLPSESEFPLTSITREQYLNARYERPGRANPEDLTEPFRLAMIRSGCNAYKPRRHFDDKPTLACGRSFKDRPPQVWCFDRFGQSFTLLPDGRIILIAGEHEDSYDPDFCIYNDVTVFFPNGDIRVFGYPYDIFEPTDFHTATLIENFIWIIGGLGYPDQRGGPVPVYRLDTRDYSIERISTTGDVPLRFHRHRAILRDGGEIEVTGGATCSSDVEEDGPASLKFDTVTRIWTQLT